MVGTFLARTMDRKVQAIAVMPSCPPLKNRNASNEALMLSFHLIVFIWKDIRPRLPSTAHIQSQPLYPRIRVALCLYVFQSLEVDLFLNLIVAGSMTRVFEFGPSRPLGAGSLLSGFLSPNRFLKPCDSFSEPPSGTMSPSGSWQKRGKPSYWPAGPPSIPSVHPSVHQSCGAPPPQKYTHTYAVMGHGCALLFGHAHKHSRTGHLGGCIYLASQFPAVMKSNAFFFCAKMSFANESFHQPFRVFCISGVLDNDGNSQVNRK